MLLVLHVCLLSGLLSLFLQFENSFMLTLAYVVWPGWFGKNLLVGDLTQEERNQ